MYLCIDIYIYIPVNVNMYTNMYVYIHIYVHMNIYIYIYEVYAYVYNCIYVYMYVFLYLFVCLFTFTHICRFSGRFRRVLPNSQPGLSSRLSVVLGATLPLLYTDAMLDVLRGTKSIFQGNGLGTPNREPREYG